MSEFDRFSKPAVNNNEPHALNWDDEISQDAQEFIVLEPGVYPFTVEKFERKLYEGGDKIPECPMAEVYLTIHTNRGDASIRAAIFLHQKMEWQISSFFRCIGMKKKGETLRMDWNSIPGKTGYVEVGIQKYKDKDYNRVKRFIDPDNAPKPATTPQGSASGYTAGKF